MANIRLIVGILTVSWCSGLLLPYDLTATSYNALLDYKVARSYARDDAAITNLGELFMQHGVNDTFGLCLLHNHFKIRAGELMIETVLR
jgi:hypothetical protein